MSPARARGPGALRPLQILPDPLELPLASAQVRWGRNWVLCAVSLEERVPGWRSPEQGGWVTAEYGMLPAATGRRNERERERRRPDARSLEISRLLGRSLRAMVDLPALGARTLRVDCDVLQADGGTRCASITGGAMALELALERLVRLGRLERSPLLGRVAAVSAGLVDGELLLDLDYSEDHRAELDINFVLAQDGRLVEVQGTGEGAPFSLEQMTRLATMAQAALPELHAAQEAGLRTAAPLPAGWESQG